ncbi:MAG: hypothetical protein OEY56_09645 [Cyclobacteriaceae bacterium]|nr:hypothetical protein [Cyclobacteriaceae bacterium]
MEKNYIAKTKNRYFAERGKRKMKRIKNRKKFTFEYLYKHLWK